MDYSDQQREASAIRADMKKAFDIINDAKTRYLKEKLKSKSKKQAEDAALMFADLADYANKNEIQDYYGYGDITEHERDRLMNLWDMREQHAKNGNKYQDRVIEMLEKAMSRIGDDYQDFLFEADALARENERNQREIWRFKKNDV